MKVRMAHGHRCTVCGGSCKGGLDHSSLHLHVEIENLKQKLLERENHIITMETNFLTEVDKFPNGECAAMADELLTWQEKYARLYESHKRVQKVNQNLEDKLLKIVDKCETEKFSMTKEINYLKQKLCDANLTINCTKEENERTRNDFNLAIQLLQCKPSNFVPQKFESLPSDLQQKVKVYVNNKKKSFDGPSSAKHELKTIKVPIPTFPPTAMFYSVNKSAGGDGEAEDEEKGKPVDIVSAAIVAKILEEREKERQNLRHCDSCICPLRRNTADKVVQTDQYVRVNLGDDVIRVESYQSASPTVSSVTLIERSPVAVSQSSSSSSGTPPTPTSSNESISNRRSDTTKLNVGRNRYHSSKLSRGVNRRRERSELEANAGAARHSEIHIDDSGEVSCDISTMKMRSEQSEGDGSRRSKDVNVDSLPLPGARRCSVSIHPGSSNILLDNATCYVPTLTRTANSHAFLHSSRSSSTSSMEERPTETQI